MTANYLCRRVINLGLVFIKRNFRRVSCADSSTALIPGVLPTVGLSKLVQEEQTLHSLAEILASHTCRDLIRRRISCLLLECGGKKSSTLFSHSLSLSPCLICCYSSWLWTELSQVRAHTPFLQATLSFPA